MDRWTRKLGPHPFSLLFTGIFAVLFGALLVYLCVILGADRAAVGLNLLVALLGALFLIAVLVAGAIVGLGVAIHAALVNGDVPQAGGGCSAAHMHNACSSSTKAPVDESAVG